MARDAITPGAPFSTQGPKSIYDVSRKHLVDMANDHFNGYWVDTPFSSWTSSLAFVTSLTLMTKSQTYSCSHISILDTSKLPVGVTILFTPAMRILDKNIAHGDHEFMAFGVISGPCHTAVDVKALRHQGIARLFDPKCNLTRNWYRLSFSSDGCFPQNTEDEVAVALQAGELFGRAFKIPFAAYALTLRPRSAEQMAELIQLLQSPYRMQHERGNWDADPTIMGGPVFTGNFKETERAISLLAALAMRVSSVAPILLRQLSVETAVAKGRVEDTTSRKHDLRSKAVASITESKRFNKDVKALYCDMIGWEDPVREERLRKGRVVKEE